MSRRNDPNPTGLAATIAVPFVAFVRAIENRAKEKHAIGRVTLGIPFFLIGCYLPYLFGWVHHNPGAQFTFGVLCGIVGVVTATIINFTLNRKHRKSNVT